MKAEKLQQLDDNLDTRIGAIRFDPATEPEVML
jgi:hypothetical protein